MFINWKTVTYLYLYSLHLKPPLFWRLLSLKKIKLTENACMVRTLYVVYNERDHVHFLIFIISSSVYIWCLLLLESWLLWCETPLILNHGMEEEKRFISKTHAKWFDYSTTWNEMKLSVWLIYIGCPIKRTNQIERWRKISARLF